MIEKYVNAEELKRLLSSLLLFVGALVITGLFASIVVPGLRNANKPAAPTPVNPVAGEPGWLDPTEYPPQRGKDVPAVDPKTLLESSPALLARGKDLYLRNCAQCHGDLGHGDGPAATMKPSPRNFGNPDGWTNGHTLPAIFKTLREGVKGTSMAPFEYLSKADRMSLTHYVQSLGQFPHGDGSPEEMASLSEELAAPGEKTPNKIPLSLAITKLETEFKAPPPLEVSSKDRSREGDALRRVIIDPSRASLTLSGSRSWREGPGDLAPVIVPGSPTNGFSVSAATQSPAGWVELQSGLKQVEHHADSGSR